MLFNSFQFLLFLPVVFALYWFVFNRSLKLQNALVLAASYFFYGWWSYKFLGLLVLSTLLDFAYAFGVASANRNKAKFFLWLSVVNNFGILALFKYYNFFVTQLQHGLASFGLNSNPALLHIALPVGISFYTFHGMSYVFDIYRGKQKPVTNFIDYAVFVSFFPLLVAGPIERAAHLLPQVQKRREFSYLQAVAGARLILWGLFKKVVIADTLAGTVDEIFQHYQNLNGITLLIGAVAFSFQIYGDFSGYSDIAIGTAKLFGFELFSNFKFPYFSRDIAEFWRRWHISLSSWFRDYLYYPLGGSKRGMAIAVRNTFIIFLVSGFWHGAGWNYIVWGAIHACGFLPLLLLNRNRKHVSEIVAYNSMFPSLKELISMLGTFAFVTFAWVFFRAVSLHDAVGYLKLMLVSIWQNPGQVLNVTAYKWEFIYIFMLIAIDWWLRRDERELRNFNLRPVILNKVITYLLYIIMLQCCFLKMHKNRVEQKTQTFIYFQF